MNQFLIALLLTLVGPYIAYLLPKSYGRWRNKKRAISEFSESLRHTLPEIRKGVIDAYIFSGDLNKYLSVLKENELKVGYKFLPSNVKRKIEMTSNNLNEFVKEFRRMSSHIYTYFEGMEDRVGQGTEKINTIVATKLVCMNKEELPSEKTVINFPREMKSHFSQVQVQPNQVAEIWDLGQKGNARNFLNKRKIALEHIDKLDKMLDKLHRVW